MTWSFVKPRYFTKDYFAHVPGPESSAASEPKQMDVLKGYEYRGKEGDLLNAFMLLYPGDIDDHVARVTAAMNRAAPSRQPGQPIQKPFKFEVGLLGM